MLRILFSRNLLFNTGLSMKIQALTEIVEDIWTERCSYQMASGFLELRNASLKSSRMCLNSRNINSSSSENIWVLAVKFTDTSPLNYDLKHFYKERTVSYMADCRLAV